MTKAAAVIAGKGKNPGTHRIGFDELADFARAWREMRNGNIQFAMHLMERTLESIDPRWRTL